MISSLLTSLALSQTKTMLFYSMLLPTVEYLKLLCSYHNLLQHVLSVEERWQPHVPSTAARFSRVFSPLQERSWLTCRFLLSFLLRNSPGPPHLQPPAARSPTAPGTTSPPWQPDPTSYTPTSSSRPSSPSDGSHYALLRPSS